MDPSSQMDPTQCAETHVWFESPGYSYYLNRARQIAPEQFVLEISAFSENPRVGCEVGAAFRQRFHRFDAKRGSSKYTGGGVTIGKTTNDDEVIQ